MKRLLTIIAAAIIALSSTVKAQDEAYKFDVGGALGLGGYLGEANQSNIYAHPSYSAQVFFRYLINTRWALKTNVLTTHISGNTADMENVYPEFQPYEFSSQVYDLSARIEYNFFPYGIGEKYKKLHRLTPYLSLGIGANISVVDGHDYFAGSIPMGVGLKFKLKPRINLGCEFTMAKCIGDHIDGKDLKDLYLIKSSFAKNTDWISTFGVSISFEFGERCTSCFYVD